MNVNRAVVLVAAFAVLPAGCARSSKPGAAALPAGTNVLLVTLDTTRADRLGLYGYARAQTPALDAVAARAAVFDDAHTTVTLTLPSHATIMTGRFPREHGLRVNGESQLGGTFPTLASIFQSKGHRTAAFVSSFVLDAGFGLDRGFTVYDDAVGDVEPGQDRHEAERTADAVTARALDWLQAHADQPFFCWIHYYDPHDPYQPPPDFRQRHPNLYDGEIAFMDSELSKVMAWLGSKGLVDRTLIVIAGDHGESMGEHGEVGHTTFLYETNVRVPLMFAHPQAVKAGRIAAPVSLVDVFPTILDLFGLSRPEGLMGRSLAGALSGGQPDDRPCYAESEYAYSVHNWAQQRCLIDDAWKFVLSPKPELYDRLKDPGETQNLAQARPDVVASMQAALRELYGRMTPTGSRSFAQSQETLKRLESLGYVSGGGGSRIDELMTAGLPDPKELVEVMRNLQHAHRLAREKRFAEALPLLEDAGRRSPGSAEILRRLGRAYLGLDRTADAVETLKKAVQLDPLNLRVVRALADAFQQARRFPEAIEHYEICLELSPDDPTILDKLGSALLESGQVDQAIARFRKAVDLKPDHGEALIDLGAALTRQGALADAETVLLKAAAIPQSAAQAHYLLAKLAARRSQKERVFVHLEKAVELKPGYEQAVEALTDFYLRLGRTADAVRILRAALRESPGHVTQSLTLAEILATSQHDALRNGQEAVQIAEPLVAASNETDPRALTALAAARAETGDFVLAAQMAEKALALVESAGDEKKVSHIRAQLEAYRAKRPYRTPGF